MADEAKKRSRGSKKGSMKGSKKGSKKKVVSNKGGKPTRTPIIPASKREKVDDVDMDRQADDDDEEEEEEQQHEEEEARVWRPGVDPLEEGEELDYDSSAYLAFHRMTVDWPCLSFDIIKDSLGQFRKNFPMQMYMVSGTQADQASKNKVMMLKISNIRKTKNDEAAEDDVVHSSDDDDDDDEVAGQPVLQERWWKHAGGVNRVRCMPQSPGFVATWADTGRVHIWDASHLLHSLDKPTSSSASSSAALANQNAAGFDLKPVYTFGGHTTEGFALDWSRCTPGRLATGDCDKFIYIWNSRTEGGTWDVNKVPYVSHTASVEDIQWSPNEAAVFASCSVDKTIRVWDVRQHDKSMLFVAAHKSDVNVISWNSKVSHLLLSGADDGGVKVWDLRKFRSDSPAAHFKWHSKAITSVEWHPTDESIMAVSSADNTISVWDMAIEDDSEVTQEGAKLESHVPAQLLFVHQGQQDPKEVHWHPNIPGLLVSTAADGYNIFKPANLEPDEDEEEEEDEGDDDVDV